MAALYLKQAIAFAPVGWRLTPLAVIYHYAEFNIKSFSSYGLVAIFIYAIFAYCINGDNAPVVYNKYEPKSFAS